MECKMEHKTSLNNQRAWPKYGSTRSICPRKLFPFFFNWLIIHLVTVFAKFVLIEQQVVWMDTGQTTKGQNWVPYQT